jgi:pimeloyl-ACP methyl ester carboxylesterase
VTKRRWPAVGFLVSLLPALILKADASAEVRAANEEADSVMQNGRMVHIEGAGHNLHHDELDRTVEVLTEFLSTL